MAVVSAQDRRKPRALPVVLCVFIVYFFGTSHYCQAAGRGEKDLARDLRAMVTDPTVRSAKIGVVVVSTTTGKNIFVYNPDRRLVPASNMKLLTSAAALFVLTPDFRYETRLTSATNLEVTAGQQIVEASLELASQLTPGPIPVRPKAPPYHGSAKPVPPELK